MSHTHNALDVPPDCVTLCVDDGTRWWHAPVAAIAWEVAPEDVRETWRGIARRPSGDDTLPVTVVTREDVGPFPGE